MLQYLKLLRQVVHEGVRQKNRTGIDTFMVPGGCMKFDLHRGFPILTTKQVAFKAVVAELIGFIRGYTSADQFRHLGTKIWDANANENQAWLKNANRNGTDDLGRIYGAQWRDWQGVKTWPGGELSSKPIDQLFNAYRMIKEDPTSRRIIVTAWNPGELEEMALPPCHLLYQFLVEQEARRLHMTMYMRSCDMFLGVPFNISSYALLLSLMAKATGYEPGQLTMFLADVHIYENHFDQSVRQLARESHGLPRLLLPELAEAGSGFSWLCSIKPEQIQLENYVHSGPLKGEMAI